MIWRLLKIWGAAFGIIMGVALLAWGMIALVASFEGWHRSVAVVTMVASMISGWLALMAVMGDDDE